MSERNQCFSNEAEDLSCGVSFSSRGFALIRRAIPAEEVGVLAAVARQILTSAGPTGSAGCTLHNILTAQPKESGPVAGRLSLHIEHVFRFAPRFRALVQDPRLAGPAQEVIAAPLMLLDDQLYWKPAHTGGATYVHRDSDFFGPLRIVTVWVPLVDVDESNGCLWVVPGSHLNGITTPGLERRTEPPPNSDIDSRPFDYFYATDWDAAGFQPVCMAAGDALLIHHRLVHCSLDIRGEQERLSYLVEYVEAGDASTFREECSGLFEYHDRWRYMEDIRVSGRAFRSETTQ